MFDFWKLVGVALLAWVGYDLYAGLTLAWDVIYRDEDPIAYWGVLSVWLVLAISCFVKWE